ncbi:MAG: AEC family transporter, partial [Clostridia bacterium]|nr:AEC family transporter [Clostridia bacterium]
MLDTFLTVIKQVAILFILMAAGFFLSHRGVIDASVRKGITFILVNLTTPCIIITKMQTERTFDRMTGLAVTGAVYVLFTLGAILLSRVISVKMRDKRARASARMCMIYKNCGFMGLPLLMSLSGIIGEDALFFGSVVIGVSNALMFTHGVYMLGGAQTAKERLKIIFGPAVIGLFIGAALFFSQITLPEVVYKPVDYIGSMNTPLA